jgi:hypothetical protein
MSGSMNWVWRRGHHQTGSPESMFVTKRIGLARAVGFLPLYFPSALAFATPSCCRPGIDHARIQPRPPAWSHREHDQAHATVVHNPQQVGGASGEPVGLAGYQGIATADEAWGFLEPVTMGCGGNLLREDFLAPSTGQGFAYRKPPSWSSADHCLIMPRRTPSTGRWNGPLTTHCGHLPPRAVCGRGWMFQ